MSSQRVARISGRLQRDVIIGRRSPKGMRINANAACVVVHKGKRERRIGNSANVFGHVAAPITIAPMKLKAKVLALAVAPLLLAIALIGGLLTVETQRLESQQSQIPKDCLLSTKRDELRNYMALALTSIDHLYGAGRNDEAAKEQAKAILSSMNFGDDGYFYVYANDGLNLVHPRQPDLVGQNLWNMHDSDGTFVIRELIARA